MYSFWQGCSEQDGGVGKESRIAYSPMFPPSYTWDLVSIPGQRQAKPGLTHPCRLSVSLQCYGVRIQVFVGSEVIMTGRCVCGHDHLSVPSPADGSTGACSARCT